MVAQRRPVGIIANEHSIELPAPGNEAVVQMERSILAPLEIVRRIGLSSERSITMIRTDESLRMQAAEAVSPFRSSTRFIKIHIAVEVAGKHARPSNVTIGIQAIAQCRLVRRRGHVHTPKIVNAVGPVTLAGYTHGIGRT